MAKYFRHTSIPHLAIILPDTMYNVGGKSLLPEIFLKGLFMTNTSPDTQKPVETTSPAKVAPAPAVNPPIADPAKPAESAPVKS